MAVFRLGYGLATAKMHLHSLPASCSRGTQCGYAANSKRTSFPPNALPARPASPPALLGPGTPSGSGGGCAATLVLVPAVGIA
jgi:hypothetical protein